MKSRGINVKSRRLALVMIGVCMMAGLLAYGLGRRHRYAVTPQSDAIFVSSRYITALATASDDTVWASSRGGILRHEPDGHWTHFTRRDGLPSDEVRSVRLEGHSVLAATPRGAAAYRDGRWQAVTEQSPATPSASEVPGRICSTLWEGRDYVATIAGLKIREGAGSWRDIMLPPSMGTHISALLPHGNALWAAMFGDGIWAYDGRSWQPAAIGLPTEAREITALAEQSGVLWLGTRRAGLWECRDRTWRQYLQPDEPVDHNCQALAMFRDNLYVSTLEDGLAVRTTQGWGHIQAPTISSNAPRQMVSYGGALYVRHGSGKVDVYDGVNWRRDICHSLPRKEASAIAADMARLYVAQWGGWSEFDGKTWTHFLNLPELQGVPITVVYPEEERLWIGTQGRGLAEYDRANGNLRWHDERNGMPDDWITAILRSDNGLYAGTFVGGLARWDGTRWLPLPELAGENVTALERGDAGEAFVATRHGSWRLMPRGAPAQIVSHTVPLDPEAQALCRTGGGIWIGTRTGLFFVTRPGN